MSAPSASSSEQNCGLSSRKQPCAATCAESGAVERRRPPRRRVASLAGQAQRVGVTGAQRLDLGRRRGQPRAGDEHGLGRPVRRHAGPRGTTAAADGPDGERPMRERRQHRPGQRVQLTGGDEDERPVRDVVPQRREQQRVEPRGHLRADVAHRLGRQRAGPRHRQAAQAEPQRLELLVDVRCRAERPQPRPAAGDGHGVQPPIEPHELHQRPLPEHLAERGGATARGRSVGSPPRAPRARAARGGGPRLRAAPGGGAARRRGGPRAAPRRAPRSRARSSASSAASAASSGGRAGRRSRPAARRRSAAASTRRGEPDSMREPQPERRQLLAVAGRLRAQLGRARASPGAPPAPAARRRRPRRRRAGRRARAAAAPRRARRACASCTGPLFRAAPGERELAAREPASGRAPAPPARRSAARPASPRPSRPPRGSRRPLRRGDERGLQPRRRRVRWLRLQPGGLGARGAGQGGPGRAVLAGEGRGRAGGVGAGGGGVGRRAARRGRRAGAPRRGRRRGRRDSSSAAARSAAARASAARRADSRTSARSISSSASGTPCSRYSASTRSYQPSASGTSPRRAASQPRLWRTWVAASAWPIEACSSSARVKSAWAAPSAPR